ncbi:MAG: GNAT family protein [Chitinophagaceae bacterium]|nr:GNAT family protein [Chitinophagaceae bacterium]
MISLDDFFEREIILENKRVKLSPLKEESGIELDKIAYDPKIWEMWLTKLENKDDLKQYINTALKERLGKQSYPFVIFDKLKNEFAGSTRYMAISFPNKRLEIGSTWMNPRFQGTGLNKACKFELLRFAFEELGLNRVELKTDVLNLRSRKAILKTGAKEEGIFRKHAITWSGRERDSVFFSITNEEWPIILETVFSEYLNH